MAIIGARACGNDSAAIIGRHGKRRQTHAPRQDFQGQLRQAATAPRRPEENEEGCLNLFLILGSALAAIGVALGAFGAHALRARLPPEMLALWQTAVLYHIGHALGVLVVALAMPYLKNAWVDAAAWLLAAGVVLFSGSLYALALGAPRIVGAITPFGGLAFILGWLSFAWAALRL